MNGHFRVSCSANTRLPSSALFLLSHLDGWSHPRRDFFAPRVSAWRRCVTINPFPIVEFSCWLRIDRRIPARGRRMCRESKSRTDQKWSWRRDLHREIDEKSTGFEISERQSPDETRAGNVPVSRPNIRGTWFLNESAILRARSALFQSQLVLRIVIIACDHLHFEFHTRASGNRSLPRLPQRTNCKIRDRR